LGQRTVRVGERHVNGVKSCTEHPNRHEQPASRFCLKDQPTLIRITLLLTILAMLFAKGRMSLTENR